MKVAFSCPSCGLAGSIGVAFAGRRARCKQCRHEFDLPRVGEAQPDGYALAEPERPAPAPPPRSVYSPARGDEPASTLRRKPGARPKGAAKGRECPGAAWGAWLARGAIAGAVALALVGLLAPRGPLIAGLSLIVLGMVMVLVGFAAGAVGAFSEDFLYGFCYLVFTPYTAYYVVTRWDDLGRWFACSTAGVGLVLLGTTVLRWAGIEA